MNRHISRIILLVLSCVAILLSGCEKAEDPFVDRVQSPVLVLIEGSAGYLAGGGQYYEPVVNNKFNAPVVMAARILELDKSGLLTHAVGIDSIPVTNLSITLLRRDGTKIADLTTNEEGRITLTRTWAELGVAAPRAGSSVSLSWSGQHKGQAFTRLSRVQAVN